MASSQQAVSLRVLVAGTGVTFKISLHPSELTVSNIRGHLAAAVPLNDQILLLGPPYKVPKDSTLQQEEILQGLAIGDREDDPSQGTKIFTDRSGARRLFLFSKQALSESAPDPPECRLQPSETTLPTEAPGPSPLNIDPAASPPLHQALAAYERRLMLYLCQGRALADGADMRLQACRSCIQEQLVMGRALRAAVSNLSDHFYTAARTRAEFTATFQSKTADHASLLQRFDSVLSHLGAIALHPALVASARASGRVLQTLLDTVPVDKERTWAEQCQVSHQRLVDSFAGLETEFSGLGTSASREEEARGDRQAEEALQSLRDEVEGMCKDIRDKQASRMELLTTCHRDVVNVIMAALKSEDEDEAQGAFAPLGELSKTSKDVVPSMREDDKTMKEIMERVAESKTKTMKRMKDRLQVISRAQSSIQRVLSIVGVLRDALAQQTENMSHLEHVEELPKSYQSFLAEISRRRAYGHAVTASSRAMMERLASMRADEVKARERFLRGPGRHLMPAFFEIFVPTLATPPPLFTPQLPAIVELDTLPDVGAVAAEDTEMGQAGVSSASSLTADSQAHQTTEDAMISSTVPNEDKAEQLIVSAEEHSGPNLILDPAGGAAAEAEAKTLAYENQILRQALERLGGKPPRTYVEEAARSTPVANKAEAPAPESAEVLALRKELGEAKARAVAAQAALKNTTKSSDKISHRSFEIGDVGLFMPTGRGSGGKRTYLAFHTNCPHRYLSSDCIKGSPDFVMGRIVYQEELVAGEIGTDANPYGLPRGVKFWVLTVEILN
uniref:Autophagy-related protein 11 C-terminal domain-containing protein n=1 Tax=Amphora coffeiformis TaxID=265554 RepID=A0A7S3P905_9STRA